MIYGLHGKAISYYDDFTAFTKNIPKKPDASDADYIKELDSYENDMQAYFKSFATYLHNIYKSAQCVTINYKDAYYKLYDEYKSYQKYIQKARNNYNNSISMYECNQFSLDGSMSPSNPCYTNFDENVVEQSIANDIKSDSLITNQYEDYFSNLFREQMRDIRRYIRKEKRKTKLKKLTKNQKKKLKKKKKLQESMEGNQEINMETDEVDEEHPQVMIQEVFKNYSQTGEWSWTVWENCMSKIRQRFPQWYEVFNDYSHTMGINWNHMYMSDVRAIDISNVRIDVVALNAPNRQIESSTKDTASIEGTSVIFTDDVGDRQANQKPENELYCNACQQEFRTAKAFHIHLRGVKHIQNEIRFVSLQKPERFIEEINKENASVLTDVKKEEKHMQWLLNNDDVSKICGTYTCTICDVTCSSQKDLNSHINGEKHKANIGALLSSSPVTGSEPYRNGEVKASVKPVKKAVARIQIFLNQCTQPMIGVNYVNEYQRLDTLLECWYFCELCFCKCDRKSIIPHIASYKHRKMYLKQNYHDLYELIEQDPNSRSVKMKRLEVFSEQIEIFEGRKKMNILSEKKCDQTHSSDSPLLSSFDSKSLMEEITSNESNFLPQEVHNQIDIIELEQDKHSKCDVYNTDNIDLESDNDKEDGEIESSDDEFVANHSRPAVDVDSAVLNGENKSPDCAGKLEEGELENELNENEKINSDDNVESEDISAAQSADETESTAVNKAEFDKYEPLFINDRPPVSHKNISKQDCRLEFMRHNKERKTVRLKEVTQDIIDHFKQEAIWAFNRAKQINNSQSGNRSLLLPPSKLPIGPVYPGVSELTSKPFVNKYKASPSSTETNRIPSPELDISNIIDKIESTYGSEIFTNRLSVNVLHDVQNMLVNKSANDKLNEVVRKELLFSSDDPREETSSYSKSVRRHILSDPINVKMLNECVDLLMNISQAPYNSSVSEPSNPVSSYLPTDIDSSPFFPSDDSNTALVSAKNLDNLKMGEKMSKQVEFLGYDQPPPPNFQKISSEMYTEPPPHFNVLSTNLMPPLMSPYFTPGMIEHPSAFNYNSNFFYPYPYISSHNTAHKSVPKSSEILNNCNRTST